MLMWKIIKKMLGALTLFITLNFCAIHTQDVVASTTTQGQASTGTQAITQSRTTRRSPPIRRDARASFVIVMKDATKKGNARVKRRCAKALSKKYTKTKILIASKLMKKALGKLYKGETQEAFYGLIYDIFQNRGTIKNVTVIKNFFDEVTETSLLTANKKKAVKESMHPIIQALEKKPRRRRRRLPKKERKILRILRKIKNKRRGRDQ